MDESQLTSEQRLQARRARKEQRLEMQKLSEQLKNRTREEQDLILSENIAKEKHKRLVNKFVTKLENQMCCIKDDTTFQELLKCCKTGMKSDLETYDVTICDQYHLASSELVTNEDYIRCHYPQTYDALSTLLSDRISGKILHPDPRPGTRRRG